MEKSGKIKFLLLSRKLTVPSELKTEILEFEVGAGQEMHDVLDKRITAFSTETHAVFILDIEDVKNILPTLNTFMNTNSNKILTTHTAIENLENFIIGTFNVVVDDKKLGKTSRKKTLVTARQLFYTILYLDKFGSLREIGETLSTHRDHATILHSIKVIRNLINTKDARYYDRILTVLKAYSFEHKTI